MAFFLASPSAESVNIQTVYSNYASRATIGTCQICMLVSLDGILQFWISRCSKYSEAHGFRFHADVGVADSKLRSEHGEKCCLEATNSLDNLPMMLFKLREENRVDDYQDKNRQVTSKGIDTE